MNVTVDHENTLIELNCHNDLFFHIIKNIKLRNVKVYDMAYYLIAFDILQSEDLFIRLTCS